jgi:FMN phosphatase YigB (HAD superfamily)
MRVILFDLGNTLERVTPDGHDVLLPGAIEMLEAVLKLRDPEDAPPVTALVSDFDNEATTGHIGATPPELTALREEFHQLLERLGLARFFEPFEQRVTLSAEADVRKPDPRIFRVALDKVARDLPFHHAVFVTENEGHVAGARGLGMTAIKFRGPGQTGGDVERLSDLPPLIEMLLEFRPCGKKQSEAQGRHAAASQKNNQPDPAIKNLVGLVEPARLRQTVSHLAGYQTRWSHLPDIAKVPEWIHGQFTSLGYPEGSRTRYQQFELQGTAPQRNVLCAPTDLKQRFVLVCCHYDSISENPAGSAPGADDDASGVAAVLELARILKGVQLKKRGVMFAAFGGEEQGLWGSRKCAAVAKAEGWALDLVINLDMISYKEPGAEARITVEYDQGNKRADNDAVSKAFAMTMAQAAADYTSLTVAHTDIWNSDYMPFEEKGFVCIGVYNAYDNPFYHKISDTPDRTDLANFTEAVKMVLATIATLCA